MNGMRSSAPRAGVGDYDVEKANESATTASSLFGMLQTPATQGFSLSQKLALHGARFWARRMRAYADQLESLARCTSPDQLASVQSQFLERMHDDYKKETAAVSDIVVMPKRERAGRDQAGDQANA